MIDQLFHPFELNRWVCLGFTAWLARVGEGGGRFDSNFSSKERTEFTSFAQGIWAEHAQLILAILVPVLLLLIALAFLLLWVRCRGRFVFLENAVAKKYEVVAPWQRARGTGRSLFRWTLGYLVVALIALIPALVPLIWVGYQHRLGISASLPLALGISLPLLLLWIAGVILVELFLGDFVVPMMARHQASTGAAWRRVGHLLRHHLGVVVGYVALRAALNAAVIALVFVGGCLTCCCLFMVLMVPVVWAVVALPWLLLLRLYSLEFLRQFGPEYDLWAISEPPRLPPDMPAGPLPPDELITLS